MRPSALRSLLTVALVSASAALVAQTPRRPTPGTPQSPPPPPAPFEIAIRVIAPGEIEITNPSPHPATLTSQMSLERRTPTGWTGYAVTDLHLVESCSGPPVPSCLTIVPREVVRPVPWSGFTCSAQCTTSCRANIYSAGTYRYVIGGCTEGRQFRSEPFTMPASQPPVTAPAPIADGGASPALPPPGPGDALPEPSPPAVECSYTTIRRCIRPAATRTALQPSPYEACPREILMGWPQPVPGARPSYHTGFSPQRTREARSAMPDACCYVEFIATRCL